VIVGAAIGYFASASIEKKRQTHELKRQIYFEFIDVMARGRKVFYLEEYMKDQAWVSYNYDDSEPNETKDSWIASFEAVKLKMEICASTGIKNLIKIEWPDYRLSRFDTIEGFYQKLVPLIKSDLIMKGWWQFWRRG
jgi:hypothetical protein